MVKPPTTWRDFLRAARQRLTVASFLSDNDYNLDAMYLSGYAIECGRKIMILARTPVGDQAATFKPISAGASDASPSPVNIEFEKPTRLRL